tara:strand:- start:9020 stop:9274 length:255 start_codon:yes stop_codon:yes gene_type:complete
VSSKKKNTVEDKKGKKGRPPTKPVTKRKAYYVKVKVYNSMNNTKNDVLISRDTIPEVKQLIMRSAQDVEFLGYWNGKEFQKVEL